MKQCAETNCRKLFQPKGAETVCPECWKIEWDSIIELEKQKENNKRK